MNCLNCQAITTNPKFCSKSCSVTYNNNTRHWREKHNKKKLIIKCLNCENPASIKYCSTKCQVDFQIKEKIISGTASAKTMKNYLLTKYGNKCWECGITEWNKKQIVLELEHKDGNSQNNDEANLSLLCPNCHSQTTTYKGKNKGKGRHSRRLRYASGKSF